MQLRATIVVHAEEALEFSRWLENPILCVMPMVANDCIKVLCTSNADLSMRIQSTSNNITAVFCHTGIWQLDPIRDYSTYFGSNAGA